MREIKFRAWYGGEMRTDCMQILNNGSLDMNMSLLESWGDHPSSGDMIFMQYTGLKDKNGKEIYEGDIVRFGVPKKNYVPAADAMQVSEVRFDSGCFTTSEGTLSDLLIWHNMEVIGNIYENPELLDKEAA